MTHCDEDYIEQGESMGRRVVVTEYRTPQVKAGDMIRVVGFAQSDEPLIYGGKTYTHKNFNSTRLVKCLSVCCNGLKIEWGEFQGHGLPERRITGSIHKRNVVETYIEDTDTCH